MQTLLKPWKDWSPVDKVVLVITLAALGSIAAAFG